MEYVYKFTAIELAGIKRRREEIIKFLSAIVEIRELPEGLELAPDNLGLIRPENEQKAKE
jgi:hypothetical protein